MRRIYRFLRLSLTEKFLLIKCTFFLVVFRIVLKIVPFKKVLRYFKEKEPKDISSPGSLTIEQIVWAVELTSRYVPSTTCLTKAMVAQRLFNQHGYPTDLKIGVAKKGEQLLAAHAWVEMDGQPLVGELKDLDKYHELLTIKNQK